jgi:hypothetical protein
MGNSEILARLRGRMAEAIASSDYSTPLLHEKSIIKIKNCVADLLDAGESMDAIVLAQYAIATEFDNE